MKKKWWYGFATVMVAGTFALFPYGIRAEGEGVSIEDTFTDETFRSYVSTNFDNGDGILSDAEIAAVTEIDVSQQSIDNLEGINCFSNLKRLECYNVGLTSLDVSGNTALEYLNCNSNLLTGIDLRNNTELTNLYCSDNPIAELNVSNNQKLRYLNCSGIQSTIDVSNNSELEWLDCSWGAFPASGLSNNTKLTGLVCSSNKLTELNLKNNKLLNYLDCHANQLTELDVSGNLEIETINCGGNKLEELNLKNNTKLTKLNCGSNKLTNLNVSANKVLSVLDCAENSLSSLDLTSLKELKELHCELNQFSVVDLRANDSLGVLYLYQFEPMSLLWGSDSQLEKIYRDGYQLDSSYEDSDHNTILLKHYNMGPPNDILIGADINLIVDSCDNHTWNAGKITTQATCSKAGVKTFTCTVCGKIKKETIKATGKHTIVKDKAVKPTYNKAGKTEGSHCSICGTIIKKQQVVPKLKRNGWFKVGNKSYYYVNNVKQTGLRTIKKKLYYFNKNGVMQTGKQTVNKKTYYFDKKTGIAQTGKIKIGKKYYYFSSAKKTLGQMQTGWVKISKKKYYFSPKKKTKGEMVTGKLKIGKKTYKFNKKGECLNP